MRTHRSAHIARHAAVVFAGAASLTLTVIAGSYVVHQIADADRAGGNVAAPAAPPAGNSGPDSVRAEDTMLTAGSFELPVLFTLHRPGAEAGGAHADSGHSTQAGAAAPTAIGGKVLFGNTYVDAQVANGQNHTVTLTLGTNVFTVLAAGLPSDPVQGDQTGVTRLRTELDTRTGEVVLVLTDSAHNERTLRVPRNPAPKVGTHAAPETTGAEQPAPSNQVETAPALEV
ncbi:hypothetical protein [Nocardia altamirensis]|uniref:hypothetical protein n=1 Tax=Nocardia altamirensis TaxID=472158 RepID=UPI00114CE41F|nr:hypothetical protein [Nocardia altamirensis]